MSIIERMRTVATKIRTKPTLLSDVIPLINQAADRIAELEQQLEAARKDDKHLRKLLFLKSTSSSNSYCDDGEMQCSSLPFIDFKREPVADIELKLISKAMSSFADAIAASRAKEKP